MDEEEITASPEESKDGTYPMYFGVSCAFVALHLMSRPRGLDMDYGRRSRIGEMMLRGSARLLGLLLERAQRRGESLKEKVNKADLEVEELKRRRAEDAKANEKVVGIFATHEQSWIAERKKLRLQIQALLSELCTLKAKNEESISDLNKRIEEEERAVHMKDEALEEEANKRRELEEKLQISDEVVEELRERSKKEAQDHSSEIWKHKTAFAELVSNQRQLEAELGRALRQLEAAKQELNEVFERNEEAVSTVEKLRKDADQKDKILSAMLRKSKLDTAEKQMLLKEVKISKAKKKQAELDSEKWRNMWESSHKKSRRSSKCVEEGSSDERRPELQLKSSGHHQKTLLLEYLEAESRKERESPSTMGENIIATVNCLDHYSSDEANEQVTNDIQQLQDWVRLETEKYATILEQKHYAEIEAFTEQMRLKDEKLEAFSWQLLTMELESKRLQSHAEGLDGSLSQSRDENLKLEALLLDREKELKSVKERLHFCVQHCQKSNLKTSSSGFDPQALWSEVKITTKKSSEEEKEMKNVFLGSRHKGENIIGTRKDRYTHENTELVQDRYTHENTELVHSQLQHISEPMYRDSTVIDITTTSSSDSTPPSNHLNDYSTIYVNELSSEEPERTEDSSGDHAHSMALITQSTRDGIEEEKEVSMDPVHAFKQNNFHEKTEIPNKSSSVQKTFIPKDSSWKMDIHALGVSYKIKRLKQQLLVLEKVAGAQTMKQLMLKDDAPDGSKETSVDKNSQQIKGFPLVMSVLNKQVKRYQSLEEKTDDLCRRMHESYRTGSSRDAHNGRPKEQTEMLVSFLEETFQLQRYMVATGQKLMEIQSRITCSFGGSDGFDESVGFNKRQFIDIVKSLFREIQRGLEVRIARVIGDLEGTLASDGILRR